jgi:pyruvate-ferredoxin/flavodoxin oxidoreductase
MEKGLESQKAAVDSGQWLLYRYNPDLLLEGKNPLQLDSKAPKIPVAQYMQMENRFRMLSKTKPEDAKRLAAEARRDPDIPLFTWRDMLRRRRRARTDIIRGRRRARFIFNRRDEMIHARYLA